MTHKTPQRLGGEIVRSENAALGTGNDRLAVGCEAVGEMSVAAGRTVLDTRQRLQLCRVLRIRALSNVENGRCVVVIAPRTMGERQIADGRPRPDEARRIDTCICKGFWRAESVFCRR